ncbi:MAG: type IV secretion system protein [Ostreibacterium sp.]
MQLQVDWVYTQEISKEVTKTMSNIKHLEERLKSAKTAKETADIQTKITAQAAIMQGLSLQGDLLRQNMAAQKSIEDKQLELQHRIDIKATNDRYYTSP